MPHLSTAAGSLCAAL
ncbi:hypothetical protein [Holdemania massiliensis]